jgi:hypothetical protein
MKMIGRKKETMASLPYTLVYFREIQSCCLLVVCLLVVAADKGGGERGTKSVRYCEARADKTQVAFVAPRFENNGNGYCVPPHEKQIS